VLHINFNLSIKTVKVVMCTIYGGNLVTVYAMVSGSLSPWHGMSSGVRWKNGLQYRRQLWIYWI